RKKSARLKRCSRSKSHLAFHSRQRGECALAREIVVDNGPWIGFPGPPRGRLPGLVNPPVWNSCQLRNPAAHVIAIRIELLALDRRIEYAEVWRGVGPAASAPLPANGVIGQIAIDHHIPEPRRAFLPGDEQMLDQERCG